MKFCCDCGAPTHRAIPAGDDRARDVCGACGTIYYQNPRIIAGCIPVWHDRILLCRRAIPPREGYWTLPAGFMEMGETTGEAACRETLEEANAKVEIEELYAIFNLAHLSQVYMFFRARMVEERFSCGAESLEIRLFREDEIPWPQLSFETVTRSLRFFVEDRKSGIFRLRIEDIERR